MHRVGRLKWNRGYELLFNYCCAGLACADTGMAAPALPKKPAMPNWLRAELIKRGLAPDGPAGKLDAGSKLGIKTPRAWLGFWLLRWPLGTCCALGSGALLRLDIVRRVHRLCISSRFKSAMCICRQADTVSPRHSRGPESLRACSEAIAHGILALFVHTEHNSPHVFRGCCHKETVPSARLGHVDSLAHMDGCYFWMFSMLTEKRFLQGKGSLSSRLDTVDSGPTFCVPRCQNHLCPSFLVRFFYAANLRV